MLRKIISKNLGKGLDKNGYLKELTLLQMEHLFINMEDLTKICNLETFNESDFPLSKFCLVNGYYIPIHLNKLLYKYFEYCLALIKRFLFWQKSKLVLDEHSISGTFDQLIYSFADRDLRFVIIKLMRTLVKDFKKTNEIPFSII